LSPRATFAALADPTRCATLARLVAGELEALLCLLRDGRAEVDTIVEAARAAGGKADPAVETMASFWPQL
jgi:DNA-binding transcriptional ArsR family regulator